jgi:hypothetical protein
MSLPVKKEQESDSDWISISAITAFHLSAHDSSCQIQSRNSLSHNVSRARSCWIVEAGVTYDRSAIFYPWQEHIFLVLGPWSFFGTWNLKFGTSNPFQPVRGGICNLKPETQNPKLETIETMLL